MKIKRIIFASIFGNALEFYNLTLYGFYVSILAPLFFPSENSTYSLIASLSAFAFGFFVRPIGAILFGYIGDKYGRRLSLSLSILFMGIPSFLIAILPSYEKIGFFAPLLLFICRFSQGLCSGGEFNGATIFALEHVGKSRPGFVGGLIVGSCLLGSLAATTIAIFFNQDIFPTWIWRIPFLIGGLSSFFGLYIRRKIDESPEFIEAEKKHTIDNTPLKSALTKHLRSCLLVFSIASFDGVATYTLVTFMIVYTTECLSICKDHAMIYNFIGIASCMIACPISGFLADKYKLKDMLVIATLFMLTFSYPVFVLIQSQYWLSNIIANIGLGLMVGGVIGMQPLFSQRLFPVQDRYTGIAFSYSLGLGIMAGITPIILTMLVKELKIFDAPAYYLMSFAFLFLIIIKNVQLKRN
jgi:MHS family proline/betaine transporter-like MFS transporter